MKFKVTLQARTDEQIGKLLDHNGSSAKPKATAKKAAKKTRAKKAAKKGSTK